MNFFITGDGSVKANINLKFVTPEGSHGANFAADGQTLTKSLSIAQEIFGRVSYGKIDFVLIGLAPDCLFQSDDNLSADAFDKNLNALGEYLKLCVDCGAKPVCVILPVAPSIRADYRKKFVEPLREILTEFKKVYDFEIVDLFDFLYAAELFENERHFNLYTVPFMNVLLTFMLYNQNVLPFAEFCRMSYDYFYKLSYAIDKNTFNCLMEEIFRATLAKLKRKDKIKIAFVTDHAATWCGDDLYNLFARNPRFETTIFLCHSVESTPDDARHDFEQFKFRGLNVIGVFDLNEETPPQDMVIFLRPYLFTLSKSFQSDAMTPQTLWAYIHYGSETTTIPSYHNLVIFRLAWKSFFDSELTRKLFDERCKIGMPRAYASGLPKMDFFFNMPEKFSFPWKMTRPNAKKIIWAPHWSITEAFTDYGMAYGTFHQNFKFMYEFAKVHPEISWVVKPHPKLSESAVGSGFFSSVKAFENYLQAWNDLPNAQVFTGGYYQEIFATSDGLIHDSLSFIAEYQFTHKPMIYLTREDSTEFTELGEKILDVSYRVNGKDFEGIAALVQKVIIEGNDPLKEARQKVFDELLDYRRINGMSASEYIFHSIADELTGER
ncbi:MAG: hypothetical protein IKE46_06400 [Selenomonadaceae bacterium]|nr:hypothetical protein [Selenomonadaceae bacterium]